jgi:CRISPR/Cas system CMR-associated protein Cmr3 (group 5 of RAMP superfamily)
LNACGAADHEHEQASCDGVESSAVSDFSLVEATPNKINDVVGSSTWGFINQEKSVELGDHVSGDSGIKNRKWMR